MGAVAVLMIETEPPIMMTCADAAIPKGTILQLSGAYTVSASSGVDEEFGGIAAEEKIAGDGKLQIAVYRRGYFKVESGTANTTIGLQQVMDAGANELTDAAAGDAELGLVFGRALEAATNGQFFILDLGS